MKTFGLDVNDQQLYPAVVDTSEWGLDSKHKPSSHETLHGDMFQINHRKLCHQAVIFVLIITHIHMNQLASPV